MSENHMQTPVTRTGRMPCKVVSKNDPEKLGRIKVRFYDQSEALIPDDKLPWTIPEGMCSGGVGTFNLGHYFIGQWLEGERDNDLGNTTRILRIISSPGEANNMIQKTVAGKVGDKGERERTRPRSLHT